MRRSRYPPPSLGWRPPLILEGSGAQCSLEVLSLLWRAEVTWGEVRVGPRQEAPFEPALTGDRLC